MKNILITATLAYALKQSFIKDHDMPHGLIIYVNEPPTEDRLSLYYHEAHVQFADVLLHVNFCCVDNDKRIYRVECDDYPKMYDRFITWAVIPTNEKDIPTKLAIEILKILKREFNYEPCTVEYRIAPFV